MDQPIQATNSELIQTQRLRTSGCDQVARISIQYLGTILPNSSDSFPVERADGPLKNTYKRLFEGHKTSDPLQARYPSPARYSSFRTFLYCSSSANLAAAGGLASDSLLSIGPFVGIDSSAGITSCAAAPPSLSHWSNLWVVDWKSVAHHPSGLLIA